MTTEHLTRPEPERIAWKVPPTDRRGLLMMLATFVVGTTITTAVGLAIVRWWEGSRFGEADADVNRWLERHRSDTWSSIAARASTSSDTVTKLVLGVVLIPVFLWLFRRWHEYFLIVGGLVVEVSIFGLSSELVGRRRPPVEQLDGAPTNSFPSGHIAAATVFYGGLMLIVFMQTRRRWARASSVAVDGALLVGVIAARLYQGMHYVTDAVAGLIIGVTVLIVMYRVVHRTLPDGDVADAHDAAFDDSPLDDRSFAPSSVAGSSVAGSSVVRPPVDTKSGSHPEPVATGSRGTWDLDGRHDPGGAS